MDTRLYDTDEPGPPRGWLGGAIDKTAEARHWQEVVNVAISALEQDGSRSSDPKGELYWGGLKLHGRHWLYHILPAGRDRHGRLGRCLIALFSANRKTDFDWRLMGRVQCELVMLAADPGRLKQIVTLLHESRRGVSLTDQLVGGGSTLASTSIQRHLAEFSADLSEGGQFFGAFHQDTGEMLRQKCQVGDSPARQEPLPHLEGKVELNKRQDQEASTSTLKGCVNKSRKHSLMKNLSIRTISVVAVFFIIGYAIGHNRGANSVPKPSGVTIGFINQKEALETLSKSLQHAQQAADYLSGRISKPSAKESSKANGNREGHKEPGSEK